MGIQEALYEALAGDATLTALVADRIYPGQVPDDEAPSPWLYFAVPESVPVEQLDDGPEDVRSEVELHALADTYVQARSIVDAVRAVMGAFRGGAIRLATWAGTSEEMTEDGYHHAIRFAVWWRTDG